MEEEKNEFVCISLLIPRSKHSKIRKNIHIPPEATCKDWELHYPDRHCFVDVASAVVAVAVGAASAAEDHRAHSRARHRRR